MRYMRISPSTARLSAFAVAAGALVLYCWLLFPLAINIPFRDDFQDILIFIVTFTQADSLTAAGAAFFLWQLRGTGILIGNRQQAASDEPVSADP